MRYAKQQQSDNGPAVALANNRKYLNKLGPAGANSFKDIPSATSNSNEPRTATADERLDTAGTDTMDAKAKRLLQAQQVYLKRGVNVLNNNNSTSLMSATGGLSTAQNTANNANLSSTAPLPASNNKVYLKPTGASAGATNNTNEIIKSLGVGKVRIQQPMVAANSTGGNNYNSDDNV